MVSFKFIMISVVVVPPVIIIIYTVIKYKIRGMKNEIKSENDITILNNNDSMISKIKKCGILIIASGCFVSNFKTLVPQLYDFIYFKKEGITIDNQLNNESVYSSDSDFNDSNSNYSD